MTDPIEDHWSLNATFVELQSGQNPSVADAVGGLISMLADARDMFPDPQTTIEAVWEYLGELYALAEAKDWQPIETAPKDREVFVWGALECAPGSRPRVGSEDIERVYWNAAFKSWEATSAESTGWVPQPTHWMPLPEAPASCDRNPKGGDGTAPSRSDESAVPEGQTP